MLRLKVKDGTKKIEEILKIKTVLYGWLKIILLSRMNEDHHDDREQLTKIISQTEENLIILVTFNETRFSMTNHAIDTWGCTKEKKM